MPRVDLTPRLARESRPGGKDTILFDNALPGFGLRIHPSGRKVWIVQARMEGRSRRIVIARHGEMELAEARRRARDMLARIRAGQNPADDIRREKEAPAFREFAVEYLRRCDPLWKPSGRETVRIYLKARILPAFGRMPLDRIDAQDVAAWFDAATLSRMFAVAELWQMRPDGSNPCRNIKHFREERRERFLSDEEYRRLGEVLREVEREGSERPSAIAAIRLLMLTGCRKGEILTLRWEHVDLDRGELRLPDSKTGAKIVHLGDPAIAVLRGIEREDGNPWVITSPKPGEPLSDVYDQWHRIRCRAGIKDVRLHDLRHSYASGGLLVGEGLTMIGKLLGHNKVETTARYADLANDPLKAAANRIASRIADIAG